MSRKFYFSLLAFALTLSATVALVMGLNAASKAASTNPALSALPASDFVISIDAQRALNETLPTMLARDPASLARMNAKLDEFQKKTGINPRSFESVAIGGRISGARPHDSRAVVIARGSFNADDVLENAFAAARARGEKFQKEEQQYEGKRIILISHERSAKTEAEIGDNAVKYGVRRGDDKVIIGVIDANTLAVGDLDSVRAAVNASLGRERVDEELVRLATQTPNAVVGFSGKVPQSFAVKPSANTFEKYFASIRQFYGSFSATGTDAETLLGVRTETAEQAAEIGQALNTLKSLSGFSFARSGGGDKEASIADLLQGLTITTQGNEVQLNFKVPQGTFAPLMRNF